MFSPNRVLFIHMRHFSIFVLSLSLLLTAINVLSLHLHFLPLFSFHHFLMYPRPTSSPPVLHPSISPSLLQCFCQAGTGGVATRWLPAWNTERRGDCGLRRRPHFSSRGRGTCDGRKEVEEEEDEEEGTGWRLWFSRLRAAGASVWGTYRVEHALNDKSWWDVAVPTAVWHHVLNAHRKRLWHMQGTFMARKYHKNSWPVGVWFQFSF